MTTRRSHDLSTPSMRRAGRRGWIASLAALGATAVIALTMVELVRSETMRTNHLRSRRDRLEAAAAAHHWSVELERGSKQLGEFDWTDPTTGRSWRVRIADSENSVRESLSVEILTGAPHRRRMANRNVLLPDRVERLEGDLLD